MQRGPYQYDAPAPLLYDIVPRIFEQIVGCHPVDEQRALREQIYFLNSPTWMLPIELTYDCFNWLLGFRTLMFPAADERLYPVFGYELASGSNVANWDVSILADDRGEAVHAQVKLQVTTVHSVKKLWTSKLGSGPFLCLSDIHQGAPCCHCMLMKVQRNVKGI